MGSEVKRNKKTGQLKEAILPDDVKPVGSTKDYVLIVSITDSLVFHTLFHTQKKGHFKCIQYHRQYRKIRIALTSTQQVLLTVLKNKGNI